MTAVGIDAIEIWSGNLKLDLPETFASVKGEDPDKYRKGLGLEASSFPDVYEDIVTMGANASKRLMERRGLEPGDIGRIDVATESAFDHSKPVSTYIAGCLEQVFEGDFRHANKGERKFACVSGKSSLRLPLQISMASMPTAVMSEGSPSVQQGVSMWVTPIVEPDGRPRDASKEETRKRRVQTVRERTCTKTPNRRAKAISVFGSIVMAFRSSASKYRTRPALDISPP